MLHQIQVAIYHPEVSKKTLLSVLDSKMTPFWSHVTPDPGGDLPSRGVPKRGPQKYYAFGGPRFWTHFAQILVQFASKHGPRSKIHFLDPCHTISRLRFTIWRGSHFNLFLFGVTFWTPSDGKTPPGSGVTWSKKWSQSKR